MADIETRVAVKIAANAAQFLQGLKTAENALNGFTGTITKIGGLVGTAFTLDTIRDFALEVTKLAGQAEGVEGAFEKLADSEKLLKDLKSATHNTVSELELMKRAVQASNFGISLQALPKLLEFATLRAQQTGQSVDYLVDSIVTGIGRKSVLILDNLGISASQLRTELKGVGTETATVGDVAEAVGRIASTSLQNMAGHAETTAVQIARLGASFDNAKVSIGKFITESGLFQKVAGYFEDLLDVFNRQSNIDYTIGKLAEHIKKDFQGGIDVAVDRLIKFRQEAGKPIRPTDINGIISQYKLTEKEQETLIAKIDEINYKTGLTYQERQQAYFKNFAKGYENVGEAADAFIIKQERLIDAAGARLEALQELARLGASTEESEKEIHQLQGEIKARRDLQRLAEQQRRAFLEGVQPIEKTIVTIEQLEGKVKELETALKQATDIYDAPGLRALQKQIDDLNSTIEYTKMVAKGFDPFKDLKYTAPTSIKDIHELDDVELFPSEYKIDAAAEALEKAREELYKLVVAMDDLGEKAIVFDQIKEKVETDFTPVLQTALSGLGQAFGSAADKTQNFGDNILKVMAGIIVQLGEMILAAGLGVEAFKTSLESLQGAVGIAAGIALIALGSALSSSISNLGATAGKSGSVQSSRNNERVFDQSNFQIQVGGEFRINGADLVTVINRQEQLNGRTRG